MSYMEEWHTTTAVVVVVAAAAAAADDDDNDDEEVEEEKEEGEKDEKDNDRGFDVDTAFLTVHFVLSLTWARIGIYRQNATSIYNIHVEYVTENLHLWLCRLPLYAARNVFVFVCLFLRFLGLYLFQFI